MAEDKRNFIQKTIDRIRGVKPPPPYTVFDVILDLKTFNSQIKKQATMYENRAQTLWQRSRDYYVNNQMSQVKMIMGQRMKALDKSFSLEMFSIKMEEFIFELEAGNTISNTVMTLGKAASALENLSLFDVDTKALTDKTFRLISSMGQEVDKIMGRLENFSPFSTIEHNQKDIQDQIDLLAAEVSTDISPPDRPLDYERRRNALDYRSDQT